MGINIKNSIVFIYLNYILTLLQKGPVTEIEFQVSQVINRLEEAVIGKNYSQDNSGASVSSLNAESLSETQPKSVLQQLEVH